MLKIICFALALALVPAQLQAEDAWKALPKYEYGHDIANLLQIDREVIRAMATPASRSACAARLASLLEATDTTFAAKQYICLQLRQVGTVAEVPTLTRLLANPKTSQIARYALQSIPGKESAAALRNALDTLQGDLLVGVINSVAVIKDVQSVATLKKLAGDKDKGDNAQKVASAALLALSNIASPDALAFVAERAEQVPLLQCADALAAAGKTDQAQAIYTKLSTTGQPTGIRRAALTNIFQNQKQTTATILAWIGSDDKARRVVATGRLATLPDSELDRLAASLSKLPIASQLGLIRVLAARKGKDALQLVLSAVRSDDPALKLAGILAIGQLGDPSTIGILVDSLSQGGKITKATEQALCRLPRKPVSEAMLVALKDRPEIRGSVLEVLKKLKCYEAIDSLIAIAGEDNPDVYKPALSALRAISDPDDTDISRLVKLLLAVQGKQREEVERTILVVCEKSADRAKPVLDALAKVDPAESPKYLPLLGRLGGKKALEIIDTALKSEDPKVKEAAVRALCKWPNAEVADRLLAIANGDDKKFSRLALRSYIRVVTLKSDRPEAQTLAMLKKAMKLASNSADQQWALSRASAVRTLDSVAWAAGYLDDPVLNQTACKAIVELAHHRFLRHPNMDRFGPLLEKVSKISKDSIVVERAKKYRLGL